MKIETERDSKGNNMVKCPYLKKKVDSYHVCHACEWLSVATAEFVRCRWTQEKEDIKSGRRYYETI